MQLQKVQYGTLWRVSSGQTQLVAMCLVADRQLKYLQSTFQLLRYPTRKSVHTLIGTGTKTHNCTSFLYLFNNSVSFLHAGALEEEAPQPLKHSATAGNVDQFTISGAVTSGDQQGA